MVLLLTGDGDLASDVVVNVLDNLKHPFFRINSFDLLEEDFNISVSNNKKSLIVRGNEIDISSVGAVWYRKFGFFRKSKVYNHIKERFGGDFADNISKEFSSVLGGVVGLLKNKEWLTSPDAINLNKLEVLLEAKEVGMDIPDSHILTSKSVFNKEEAFNAFITKSIKDPWIIRNMKDLSDIYTMFTSVIDHNDIAEMPTSYFPSLIQRKIDKEYEVRVFFLIRKFYSMAIFSQSDDQTKVDFRRYNWNIPNRTIPYLLPKEIEKKLMKLVKKLKLNCCSIDLIKGKDGKYYFLEINPTGQFGMVDFPCNYNLHYNVAKTLADLDKKALA
ncbi:grasp-with-spasm system ATP-grasp peptide maturase [Olivibacter jilunii]|uniref:grasp-with-spasm system ATP-grasp peptide maturase n=1 Tax=Olivibacter jilunii TaxID=985016 RepID=UPI003F18663F